MSMAKLYAQTNKLSVKGILMRLVAHKNGEGQPLFKKVVLSTNNDVNAIAYYIKYYKNNYIRHNVKSFD